MNMEIYERVKSRKNSILMIAASGDVFVGTWGNGDIVNGKLFDKNNIMKATILAGRRPNPYNIGKN